MPWPCPLVRHSLYRALSRTYALPYPLVNVGATFTLQIPVSALCLSPVHWFDSHFTEPCLGIMPWPCPLVWQSLYVTRDAELWANKARGPVWIAFLSRPEHSGQVPDMSAVAYHTWHVKYFMLLVSRLSHEASLMVSRVSYEASLMVSRVSYETSLRISRVSSDMVEQTREAFASISYAFVRVTINFSRYFFIIIIFKL